MLGRRTAFGAVARFNGEFDPVAQHYAGKLDRVCEHCGALHWRAEATGKCVKCCQGGRVVVPAHEPSDFLKSLYTSQHADARAFINHSRHFNNSAAFASRSMRTSGSVQAAGWQPAMSFQGAPAFAMGSLGRPSNGSEPLFAAAHVVDSQAGRLLRTSRFNAYLPRSMSASDRMAAENLLPACFDDIDKCNPLTRTFKMAMEVQGTNPQEVRLTLAADRRPDSGHARSWNAPQENAEVAVVVEDGVTDNGRDIVLHLRDDPTPSAHCKFHVCMDEQCGRPVLPPNRHCGGLTCALLAGLAGQGGPTATITGSKHCCYVGPAGSRCQRTRVGGTSSLQTMPSTHQDFEGLMCPALGPGLSGWDITMTRKDSDRRLTFREFVVHRLHVRHQQHNSLFHSGRLFQQCIADQCCRHEAMRLAHLRSNAMQDKMYKTTKRSLLDWHAAGGSSDATAAAPVGTATKLPSSYMGFGSPRSVAENLQDSLAILAQEGKPDCFITMTANPSWVEITENLGPNDSAADRVDLINRVFQIKLKALIAELEGGILGGVKARIHVIEFQKRGLPHAHILIFVEDADKPTTAQVVDEVVCAEIPKEADNPALYDIITRHQLHAKCEADATCICRKQGDDCAKGFPKPFCSNTALPANNDGCPTCRRRHPFEGGNAHTRRGVVYTNECVVPYNPCLSARYNCHLNVEICNAVAAVKYMFKHCHKGQDHVMQNVSAADADTDEIAECVAARWVGSNQGFTGLFRIGLTHRRPNVHRLSLHLQDEQVVCYAPSRDAAADGGDDDQGDGVGGVDGEDGEDGDDAEADGEPDAVGVQQDGADLDWMQAAIDDGTIEGLMAAAEVVLAGGAETTLTQWMAHNAGGDPDVDEADVAFGRTLKCTKFPRHFTCAPKVGWRRRKGRGANPGAQAPETNTASRMHSVSPRRRAGASSAACAFC